MEKTADYEDTIFKKDGKLFIRKAGGQVIPYDNSINDCPLLKEGESFIKPKED